MAGPKFNTSDDQKKRCWHSTVQKNISHQISLTSKAKNNKEDAHVFSGQWNWPPSTYRAPLAPLLSFCTSLFP